MKVFKKITYGLLLFLLLTPVFVFSDHGEGGGDHGEGGGDHGVGGLINPLKFDNIPDFLDALLAKILVWSVPIIVLFIIWAGFLFVTARGNDIRLAKAKQTLMYTLIGASIILAARLIAGIIAGTITGLGGS